MDSLKVLMVDDESRMRKLVSDFLTRKGYQVIEAGDGEEAIDKFYKTRYSGINFKAQGFEQTQKRIDDLRTLIKNKKYTEGSINKSDRNSYSVELPEDYVLLLGDTAGIQPSN